MRWHYRDPLLVWLFPIAYAAHIVEEWQFGFPEWVSLVVDEPLPRLAFAWINAGAFLAMLVAADLATRSERHGATGQDGKGWLAIAIAGVAFLNGLVHILGSLLTGTYSPGLVTGVVLYLPLGQLALARAWQQADGRTLTQGLVAAVVIHGLISVIALSFT